MRPIESYDIITLSSAVREGELSVEQIAQAQLARCRTRDVQIGALIALDPTEVLRAARALDARLRAGERVGPLCGVLLAIKDNIVTCELPTTAGSRLLADYHGGYDATAVARLRAADALILGKSNLDEFGMGSSCEHNARFACRNPWRLDRVAGGSSGGSAAAVAAGFCQAALGSDTGGSIRQPAAFCGVTGLKPTYGRISRFGLIAFASSLDQIGPIAARASDCRALFEVMAGTDDHDATSCGPAGTARQLDAGRVRLGVPWAWLENQPLQMDIREALRRALDVFARQGAELVEVSLDHIDKALAAYYVLACAEASSNLARFDGVRFGQQKPTTSFETLVVRSRSEGLGLEVQRRILLGTYVLSEGYSNDLYRRAQRARSLIADDLGRAFDRCDAIVLPTTPTTAFRSQAKLADPIAMYESDIFTVAANLAGIPALSFPSGFDGDGLPIGLQLWGRRFEDELLLALVEHFQQRTSYHLQRPPGAGEVSA